MSFPRTYFAAQLVLVVLVHIRAQTTSMPSNTHIVSDASKNPRTDTAMRRGNSSRSPTDEAHGNLTSWTISPLISTVRFFNAGDGLVSAPTSVPKANASRQQVSDNNNTGFDEMSKTVMSHWAFQIGVRMFRVYPLLLLAVGTIGNVFSIVVFLRPKMIKSPTYIYLTFIAIFDTLVLLTNGLLSIGEVHIGSVISDNFCKSITFVHSASIHISVWLVVAVTIERVIATGLPMKASYISTRRNALVVICVIILVFGLVNMHMYWTMSMPENVSPPRCYADAVNYQQFIKAWNWVDASLFSFIPCVLLFVLNITVIVLMRRANRRMKRLTNQDHTSETRNAQSAQITVMLLTVSFFFLFCVTPSAVHFIYRYTYWEYRFRDYPEELAFNIFIQQILTFLLLCNHSFNFLLYAASGKKFREESSRILCCKETWLTILRERLRWKRKQSAATLTGSVNTRSGSDLNVMSEVCSSSVSLKYSKSDEVVIAISYNAKSRV